MSNRSRSIAGHVRGPLRRVAAMLMLLTTSVTGCASRAEIRAQMEKDIAALPPSTQRFTTTAPLDAVARTPSRIGECGYHLLPHNIDDEPRRTRLAPGTTLRLMEVRRVVSLMIDQPVIVMQILDGPMMGAQVDADLDSIFGPWFSPDLEPFVWPTIKPWYAPIHSSYGRYGGRRAGTAPSPAAGSSS